MKDKQQEKINIILNNFELARFFSAISICENHKVPNEIAIVYTKKEGSSGRVNIREDHIPQALRRSFKIEFNKDRKATCSSITHEQTIVINDEFGVHPERQSHDTRKGKQKGNNASLVIQGISANTLKKYMPKIREVAQQSGVVQVKASKIPGVKKKLTAA